MALLCSTQTYRRLPWLVSERICMPFVAAEDMLVHGVSLKSVIPIQGKPASGNAGDRLLISVASKTQCTAEVQGARGARACDPTLLRAVHGELGYG